MLKVSHKRLTTLAFLLGASIMPQVYAQTCIDAIPASTPTSDFDVHNDGTVTHTPTGLMWKVCSEGQTWQDGSCVGGSTTYNWQQALQAPQTLNNGAGYAGYTDWRLPNAKELGSIFEFKCHPPAINLAVFINNAETNFWSSSPDALKDDNAMLFFSNGAMISFGRDSQQPVRLVRNAE